MQFTQSVFFFSVLHQRVNLPPPPPRNVFLANEPYGKTNRYTIKQFVGLQVIFPISKSIGVLGAVADVSIAAVLIFFLQRSRTGFKKSETIINRLIIYSVNTGLLTGLVAIVSVIMVCSLVFLNGSSLLIMDLIGGHSIPFNTHLHRILPFSSTT